MMMMLIQIAVTVEVYDLISRIKYFIRYHIICIRKILQKDWGFNAAVIRPFIHFKKAHGLLKWSFLIMSLLSFVPSNSSLVNEMSLSEIYSKLCK